MQKYFIKKNQNNIVSFIEQDETHILKVMRLNVGDNVVAILNNKKYKCEIIQTSPLRAKIIEEIIDDTNNDFELNIFQSSIKPNHMEIAIAKACELNANNFYIFYSNYSQNNIQHNIERYKRIIKESCEQSNRSNLMNIKIISLDELIELSNQNNINLIAEIYESNQNEILLNIQNLKSIGIFVGPEGGYSNEDIDYLKKKIKKLFFIKLAKTILRSETALIYLLSVVSYFMLKGKM